MQRKMHPKHVKMMKRRSARATRFAGTDGNLVDLHVIKPPSPTLARTPTDRPTCAFTLATPHLARLTLVDHCSLCVTVYPQDMIEYLATTPPRTRPHL